MNGTPDISKYLKKKPVDVHWTPVETRWEKKFLGDISNFNDDFRKKMDIQFQQHVQNKKTPKRTPKNKVLSVENSGRKITHQNSNSITMYDVVKNKNQGTTESQNQDSQKNNNNDLQNQNPISQFPNIQSPTMYDLIKSKSNQKSNEGSQNQSKNNTVIQKHRSSSGTGGPCSKQKSNLRSSVKRSSSNSGVKKIIGRNTEGVPTPASDSKFVKNLTSDFQMQYTNAGPSPFKIIPKKQQNSDIKTQLFTDDNTQTPSTRGRANTAKQRSRRPSISVATPRISQNYQDQEVQTTKYKDSVLFNMQDTLKILNLSSQKKQIKNFDESKKIKLKSVNKIGRTQEILFFTQQGIEECIKVSNYTNKDEFISWVQYVINQ